jgi:hypothetical protein
MMLNETLMVRDRTRRDRLLDICFRRHLEIAEEYDKAMVLRFFTWIPAVLQLLKLLTVTGAYLPRALGLVYFAGWFLDESFLFVAARRRLDGSERENAVRLGRLWRKPIEGHWNQPWQHAERNNFAMSFPETPMLNFLAGLIYFFFLLWQLTGNFWFAFFYLARRGKSLDQLANKFWSPVHQYSGIASLLVRLGLFVLSLFLFVIILLFGMSFLFGLGAFLCYGIMFLFNSKWIVFCRRGLANVARRHGLGRYIALDDWGDRFLGLLFLMPSYLGFLHVIITLLYFNGVGARYYECWNTVKPSFYNWLG